MVDICTHAGVSTATFYEFFQAKEECVLAAYRLAVARVFAEVPSVNAAESWQPALRGALSALFDALRGDPDAGRMVFVEGLAGGPLVREQARRTQRRCVREVHALLESAAQRFGAPDIPAEALVGGVQGIAARHLRTNSEERLPPLLDGVLDWISSYAVAPGASRWAAAAHLLPAVSPAPGLAAFVAPPQDRPVLLPKGRHGLPDAVVTRIQRARIVDATAAVVVSRGYADATVREIVATAHIARDVFYRNFASKEDAFYAAQQRGTAQLFDVCAEAYFEGESWPERVWNVLATLTQVVAAYPALSRLRIVECYTVGGAAIVDTERLVLQMRVFLHEGHAHARQSGALWALRSEAIVASISRTIEDALLDGEASSLSSRVPGLAFVAIAPFVGPQRAAELLDGLSARSDPANAVAVAGS
jgi:AcrR family transcriptional regulator